MDNNSFSSAESYVAHVNDEPRAASRHVAMATLEEPTLMTPLKQLSAPRAYPTEAAVPADSRVAAAPAAAEKRGSAAGLASPNRPPSVPHDRRSSISGDFARSMSSASNNKLYFHSPPHPVIADTEAAEKKRVVQAAQPARTDIKALPNGAICTPSSSEDEAHDAAPGPQQPPAASKPVVKKAPTATKPPVASTTPVKPASRTPTHALRQDELKEESLSLPFTSNQVFADESMDSGRHHSAALVRRVSRNGSGAGHGSLAVSQGGSSRLSQQKAPRQLVARMSLSQANAGAMVPYVDSSDEPCATAYSREYGLTTVEHNPPSRRVSVQRYVPTARSTEWNSNLKEKNTAPLELLPRISLSAQPPHYARAHSASEQRRTTTRTGVGATGAGDEKHRVHSLPVTPAAGALPRDVAAPNGRQLFAQRYNESNAVQTYRDELGDALDRIDFKRALSQLNTGHVGGDDYQAALAFFSLVAKDTLTLFPEDLHELLVLFTPPGVALREAEDFMWEECENKTRLSFAECLLYGTRLRDRVFDYEQFAQLNDIQRLLVTYARVFPGRPSEDRDYARIRLLSAARDQMGDQLPDKFRPLRVYEQLFLVDYQHMLYRAGVIHSEELPPEMHGDLPSDVQAAALERRRQSATATATTEKPGKEDIEWGPVDGTGKAAPSRQVTSATKDRPEEYPSLARCNAKKEKPHSAKRSGAASGSQSSRHGRQGTAHRARAAPNSATLVPGCISSRSRGGSALRRSRSRNGSRPRQPFEVRTVRDATLDNTSRNATSRYMGRTGAAEHQAREQQDDSLIQRLQLVYTAQV